MKITKNIVPSIAYQVRTQDGVLVDEAPVEQPLEYLHGHNNLVVGLENALEGKAVGDTFEVRVKPEEGYGEYNDNMVQRVPKDVFMGVDELEVGMRFIADTDIGPLPVVITAVEGDEVVVDGNHMLAGQELLFSVEVVALREATLEEIAHGHIHGEHSGCCGGHDEDGCGCGGHHHHHHHDGCGCGGHHHEESHEGCCDEHHHHHHNGVCCDEPHHHHHSANEECCQTAGECCNEHHHHHHNGVCCDEPHHHHHSANEECCQTAGECCNEHHHHHHDGVCCDENHHHHHSADEKCNKH